jgi:hypothetical protein
MAEKFECDVVLIRIEDRSCSLYMATGNAYTESPFWKGRNVRVWGVLEDSIRIAFLPYLK